jgi:nucleoside-diphosphate-sugar epimerase
MLNYWSRLQHDFDLVNKVNYVGTKNVISACHKTGVKKLLFPSSATIFVTAGTRTHACCTSAHAHTLTLASFNA